MEFKNLNFAYLLIIISIITIYICCIEIFQKEFTMYLVKEL